MRNLFIMAYAGWATIASGAVVSRMDLDHPALGTAGGSSLHTSIESLYTQLGDAMASRYEEYSAIADSTTVELDHNLGVNLTELQVLIYSGSHPSLTRIADPEGLGTPWAIAEKTGSEKTVLEITTPASGGPHTFAVVVLNVPVDDDLLQSLSPLTTQGDLMSHDGSDSVRIARGAADEVLKTNTGGTDIEYGKIANANVDAAAAIAGTKISPNFGSQTIQTTTTVQADELRGDSINDEAGTGAPDLPNGLTLSGNADILSVYDEGSVSATNNDASGPLTGGNEWGLSAQLVRVGDMVIMNLDANTAASADASADSVTYTGFIPAGFRPKGGSPESYLGSCWCRHGVNWSSSNTTSCAILGNNSTGTIRIQRVGGPWTSGIEIGIRWCHLAYRGGN